MTYQIKIGADVNTNDVDEIFEAIGWGGLRSAENWKKVLKCTSFVVQILDNNKTIGFGRCVDDTDMCMIYDVSVLPQYQRKGVGTLIMNEIKKYITQNDFIRIQLFTYDKDKNLSQFYKKFGFQGVSTGMCIVGSRFNKKEIK